jgi:RNA polymerase sigma factor (sigma-70 family)
MAEKNAVSQVMAHLRRLALLGDGADREDAELLGRFVETRDEAAFEVLVRRHGPMVLGVCRRVLGNQEDAEDAFQATFLVLVRKAASVTPRSLVGNWLHGVARQTAVRTRALNVKRRAREKPLVALFEPPAPDPERASDWQPLFDEELGRLPARYRTVVVLCDLEGRTRKEAARQLGWPEGSVSSRLARGRALLAKRLTRRGLVLAGAGLAFLGSGSAISGQVPPAVLTSTIKVGTFLAAGQTAAATLISARVAAVTEGVLTSMFLTKLKSAATACFVLCALGVGLGVSFLAGQTPGEQAPVVRQVGQAGQTPPAASKAPEIKVEDLQRRLALLEERIQELTLQNKLLLTNLKQTVAERAAKKEIRIFTLRNLQTEEVAQTILALFGSAPTNQPGGGLNVQGGFAALGAGGALGAFGNLGGGQFGMMGAGPPPVNLELDPAKLRVATIERTNTIIVRGEPDDLQLIEGLITRLEALPVPRESKPEPKDREKKVEKEDRKEDRKR